jgi:hypothetical protein
VHNQCPPPYRGIENDVGDFMMSAVSMFSSFTFCSFKCLVYLIFFMLLNLADNATIAAHDAWSDKWLGDHHVLFANLMDQLRAGPANHRLMPYNHSISLIQSSGMGKSRLMDSVAKLKFCFPFNMREPNDRGKASGLGDAR